MSSVVRAWADRNATDSEARRTASARRMGQPPGREMLAGCVLPVPARCDTVPRRAGPPSRDRPEVTRMAKTGRNDLCSCGSGKKFKKCHGVKTTSDRQGKMLMIVVGGALIAALAAVAAQMTTERGRGTRVWDPAHGHYHNEFGREIP